MKINKTDGYRDNESCLSKELKSIKINAGRWAHNIKILLIFSCLLLAFLMCSLLPFSWRIKIEEYLHKNLHLLIAGDWMFLPWKNWFSTWQMD